MRFAYKCDMTGDPSFLLDRNSRLPVHNYTREFHGAAGMDLPFSHPGSLDQYYQSHQTHLKNKQQEVQRANNLFELTDITHAVQRQAAKNGSLGLATFMARVKAGYFRSDVVKGVNLIVDFMSESASDGCTFNRYLNEARRVYEEDIAMDESGAGGDPRVRNMSGCSYWRGIHTHNLLSANRHYTMNATNLNTFAEMLTSACGHFFGNGKDWDSFGWFIQVCDGGGGWEFYLTGRDGVICMYNRKTTSSGLDTIICGGYDDLMSWASKVIESNVDLNQKSRNILRTTAVGIERMPKVRMSESGEVGEPPDSSIRYRAVTMTEQRHVTADTLDAILRMLFRDRRGEDAIVLSTVNPKP
jgi:hypothetical protein